MQKKKKKIVSAIFFSFNEECKIFVVVIVIIMITMTIIIIIIIKIYLKRTMTMTRCLRFSSRDLDGWMDSFISVLFQLYLKLQSIRFASLSPSLFENLELQLCAELSSMRGFVLRHGFSADESNVLRSMCVSLSVTAPVWIFTVLHNHRF